MERDIFYNVPSGLNRCERCGTWYMTAHYCGKLDLGDAGDQAVPTLTEERVREIVREEIRRATVESTG